MCKLSVVTKSTKSLSHVTATFRTASDTNVSGTCSDVAVRTSCLLLKLYTFKMNKSDRT